MVVVTKWLFVLGQFSSLGYMHSNNGRDSCELFISEAKINGVSLGWLLIFVVVDYLRLRVVKPARFARFLLVASSIPNVDPSKK